MRNLLLTSVHRGFVLWLEETFPPSHLHLEESILSCGETNKCFSLLISNFRSVNLRGQILWGQGQNYNMLYLVLKDQILTITQLLTIPNPGSPKDKPSKQGLRGVEWWWWVTLYGEERRLGIPPKMKMIM